MVISSLIVLQIMSAIVGTAAYTPVDAGAALKFFNTVGKLKTLKRTGWVNNEVFEPESVADHMYRMSMLGFLITDPAVNKDRLIKVCLIHDLAESIVGDITPYDGVSKVYLPLNNTPSPLISHPKPPYHIFILVYSIYLPLHHHRKTNGSWNKMQ